MLEFASKKVLPKSFFGPVGDIAPLPGVALC